MPGHKQFIMFILVIRARSKLPIHVNALILRDRSFPSQVRNSSRQPDRLLTPAVYICHVSVAIQPLAARKPVDIITLILLLVGLALDFNIPQQVRHADDKLRHCTAIFVNNSLAADDGRHPITRALPCNA